ncbi:phosphatidate cytidylyltransferase [Pseudogemmobacter sp. W21_MBD1_M6]|uniref:phosphatidate cytidylyltransferase n=1 Tax=Pseudogemmobacter sp. W21_MBD1_M6 TaxID=3240271 RepID=UPI003F982C82
MAPSGQWDDLAPRLVTAVAMVATGLLGIWLGGVWFAAMVSICCGVMVWELARMVSPELKRRSFLLGAGAAVSLWVAVYLPTLPGFLLLIVVPAAGFAIIPMQRRLFAAFAFLILVAGFELMALRSASGMPWLLWLVLVVVATDIFGYFGGRIIGGPKLWARVSPKKTWSGAVSGWIAAGLVGLVFALTSHAGLWLVPVSVLLSMASQVGDVAESAVKRKMGVKDSSNLLPGHGGLFDRFDGLLGAAVLLLLIVQFVALPLTGF